MWDLCAWCVSIVTSTALVLILALGGCAMGMFVAGESLAALAHLSHKGAIGGTAVGAALAIVLLTRYWGTPP